VPEWGDAQRGAYHAFPWCVQPDILATPYPVSVVIGSLHACDKSAASGAEYSK
jgi:hypothetical protein